MKNKATAFIKPVVFLLIGITIFSLLQDIFIPAASQKRENADRIIDGIRRIEPGTVDVIFIGPSGTEYGVSPIRLYEKTGICGYSLATSGQPIEAAYWLLKDAFTKQKPTVVVLQAGYLFDVPTVDKNTIRWWHILDNYRLSEFKFDMVRDYDTVPYSNGWIPALFPIAKYHTRWNKLAKEDFDLNYGGEYYSLGEWVNGIAAANTYATIEEINGVSDILQQDSYITERTGDETKAETIKKTYVPPQITDYAMQSFLKIKELCDENKAELVLAQIPKLVYPQYGGAWMKSQSDEVHKLAQSYDIAFYDLQYDTDIGINWVTDTHDAGGHLNIRGAEKVADVLGTYLLDHCSVRQQSNPQYDAYATLYDKVREVAMLQSEMDLAKYLDRLSDNSKQWSVFIAASDEYTAGMKAEIYDRFESLGLSLIRNGNFRDAYMAFINRGNVEYEAVSGRRIDHVAEVNGVPVSMSSAGWNVSSYCAITLNGKNYALGGRGLSIVVYDNENGLVIDSVCFDTSLTSNSASRNWSSINAYLRAYESKVCFGEDAA